MPAKKKTKSKTASPAAKAKGGAGSAKQSPAGGKAAAAPEKVDVPKVQTGGGKHKHHHHHKGDTVKRPSLSPRKKKSMYFFSDTDAPQEKTEAKNVLGGKGAGLCTMTRLGLPVPSGFVITTSVCTYYMRHGKYPLSFHDELQENMAKVEEAMGRKFGSIDKPLLFSVRSGARVSMPGMMDTILNLGLNDKAVQGLAKESGSERFAYDCYRRFIAMFGEIAKGIGPASKKDRPPFDGELDKIKEEAGVESDVDLSAEHLKTVVKRYKAIYEKHVGEAFPQDPQQQLVEAITAVFASWNNERAIAYRKMNRIPAEWGTACNVQSMVYGNFGETSATGVAFTRDPATGKRVFYGEYLINAQGEDVVAGLRTPQPINHNTKTSEDQKTLEEAFPEVYKQLDETQKKLELFFKNMQDLEFTIMQGKLYMLQTRDGKRTARAAFKMAADMVEEGLISKEEALLRLDAEGLNQFLRPVFDLKELKKAHKEGRAFAKGLPAGPGAAAGTVVFSSSDAEEAKKRGEAVILVRVETSPEDIKGMDASEGIVTARGGMTSHAALVGRQMGKVAVVGAEALIIDYHAGTMKVKGNDDLVIKAGDWISIDGHKGDILTGKIQTNPSEVLAVRDGQMKAEDSDDFQLCKTILDWADSFRKLHVRTNADQADQAANAMFWGAEGIGLCRTEHMFFGGEKILAIREFIVAKNDDERAVALKKLLPIQKADFKAMFEVLQSKPLNVRLLDPPLHEFLPHTEKEYKELEKSSGKKVAEIKQRCAALAEANPMLGHRGCRLGITMPQLPEMQTRAIVEAAAEVQLEQKVAVYPEIFVPMVASAAEFKNQSAIIRRVIAEVLAEKGIDEKDFHIKVGTMIETPRSCLVAEEIAKAGAEFFSFGTNDLTQSTFLMSRDDAPKFLPLMIEEGIYTVDPFVSIDVDGVGQLIEMATKNGKAARNGDLEVGLCGEQGGEPASIMFLHKAGLDYVSCSPLRLPIARLAAAQAALTKH